MNKIHRDDDPILTAGMHLRDYFAAKVMQGILSSPAASSLVEVSRGKDLSVGKFLSRASYRYADEMLKAREAK